jgi:hypothetical protein
MFPAVRHTPSPRTVLVVWTTSRGFATILARCLPSAQSRSEEEKRDTSRNRGPRAGALFFFLSDLPSSTFFLFKSLISRKRRAHKFATTISPDPKLLRGKMPSSSETAASSTKLLGACWIIYGLARILLAFWLLAFEVTAKLMFGALLSRVPNPYAMMDHFHIIYYGIVLISIVCGALGIVAGLALLVSWSVGRALALCAAFLSLPEMPLGLMLGVYTIVRLLPPFTTNTVAVER